ncbi:indole acetimide hydrolase [Caballeronia fortuita]|uniref:Indole acetimide hydrolase n=1 Tax=Caballeronia fortuita TaxID=1777138 RepID=A0A158CC43_9BURK|nr:indoleacetamide hydrolase [Caballeronia fortuita]SAK79486.1 indole acetimide hydrolase [Caballeronia fortuita]
MPTSVALSLTEVRNALLRREFSCVEYALGLIERQARWRYLNGFAYFDENLLLAQAARCDRELRSSEAPRLLLGIPIAVKDNIDTAAMPTGNGTMALRSMVPPQNAPTLVSLLKHGAMVAGKANMHELAFGVTNNNRVMGAVRNPYDFSRIPGGSSGGSGALVGAGVVPAALGTDTGGSVRIPAALCGAVGLRPTSGRYPSGGVAPISRTRDTVGPIARTVRDIAFLDAIITGDEELTVARKSKGRIRLIVPRTTFWKGLTSDVEAVANAALSKLEQIGAELIEVDLREYPDFFGDAVPTIAMYEFKTSLQGYLNANGYDMTVADIVAQIGSPDVAEIAHSITGPGAVSEESYRAALDERARLKAAYEKVVADHRADALVFPTTITTACPISTSGTMVLHGVSVPIFPTFTRNMEPGSNAGVPGITLPAGLTTEGLPVGLSLDAAPGTDRQLLATALEVEAVLGPLPPPEPEYGAASNKN